MLHTMETKLRYIEHLVACYAAADVGCCLLLAGWQLGVAHRTGGSCGR